MLAEFSHSLLQILPPFSLAYTVSWKLISEYLIPGSLPSLLRSLQYKATSGNHQVKVQIFTSWHPLTHTPPQPTALTYSSSFTRSHSQFPWGGPPPHAEGWGCPTGDDLRVIPHHMVSLTLSPSLSSSFIKFIHNLLTVTPSPALILTIRTCMKRNFVFKQGGAEWSSDHLGLLIDKWKWICFLIS